MQTVVITPKVDTIKIETRKIEYTCSGCGNKVPMLYQNKLCKHCLVIIFSRMREVIDSVRSKTDTITKFNKHRH